MYNGWSEDDPENIRILGKVVRSKTTENLEWIVKNFAWDMYFDGFFQTIEIFCLNERGVILQREVMGRWMSITLLTIIGFLALPSTVRI